MSSRKSGDRGRVADRLHSAAIHLLRRLRKTDSQLGLSASRLSALSVLVFSGDKSLSELARAEQVQPPTMSKLVHGLEADGLVKRLPAAADKRAIRLRATARGRRILNQGRQLRIAELTQLMESLSATDVEALGRAAKLLEKLSAQKPMSGSAQTSPQKSPI